MIVRTIRKKDIFIAKASRTKASKKKMKTKVTDLKQEGMQKLL